MAHIPEQLAKINTNIIEAETILSDLKKRTKTENVAEQIEHFESMLNKLNNLKDSYLQLSAQFETSSKMKNSLLSVTSALQNKDISDDQFDQVRQGGGRQKKVHESRTADTARTCSLNVDVSDTNNPLAPPNNTFTDLVSDLDNFVGLDLSFYRSILDNHIDIGSKMIDMVDGLSLSDNLEQGICLLKDVIQRLMELRERFQSVENTKENIQNQEGVDENTLQQEMETINAIFEDLKINFATGVKCFKSAMDIIQSYLNPNSIHVNNAQTSLVTGNHLNESIANCSAMLPEEENNRNNNNSCSASEDNNNRSNGEEERDDNNDGGDEESEDSCREKDQDESMEIGVGNSDSTNDRMDQYAMRNLRLQTEFEQKEIMKLLEEKRLMQKKLADLKIAKEVAKNQALSLTQSGEIFGNFSHFLRSGQSNHNLNGDSPEVLSNSQRPDTLALRTDSMVTDMGNLLKLLSDLKSEVPRDDFYQNSPSRMTNSNQLKSQKEPTDINGRSPFTCSSYSTQSNVQLSTLNEKADEFKQKQCQLEKLQKMLDHMKIESCILNESIIRDSNDDYHCDHNNERENGANGRPGKGRDSVTFQEPVATFIANEELYENMREVRMRREELRDRSARNSNSDPRSPCGRVLDSGNAPGAPPDVPARMPVTSHETASQDRTTAATWGSSSGGGDDYEDHNCSHNELSRDNILSRGSPLVTGTSTISDERSRVAPVGQSATFRSKARDSSSTNIIDNEFDNLKEQIENIASLCRNMALEQNRLVRDMADLKSGSSPRVSSNGPDLVMSERQPPPLLLGVSKHGTLTDDNLQQWAASSNASARMATSVAECALRPSHIDTSWEEASITSSTAVQHQLYQQRQSAGWYGPPLMVAPTYQTVLQQQNMILQNHALFLKLHMSLVASQLEQQRLCMLSIQQCGPVGQPTWPLRGLTPPYYPPPGPLITLPDSSSLTAPLPPSLGDLDCGLYSLYVPDHRPDPAATSSSACNSSNLWKNTFPAPGRHIHR